MVCVYQAATPGEAHLQVAFVKSRGMADILVHRVSSLGLARGAALWFITKNKQDADLWVYPCSQGMAQLCVCFVDNYAEAGWVKQPRYQHLFR